MAGEVGMGGGEEGNGEGLKGGKMTRQREADEEC